MHFLTSEQMRTWDRRAIGERDIRGLTLMNRAGAAVARVVARLAAARGEPRVLLLAGRGNNGGDACVAARCLHEDGLRVELLLTCPPDALRGDARAAWDRMRAANVPHLVRADPREWAFEAADAPRGGVIVDGLLGTGSEGAPHGVAAAAIRWINAARRRSLVVAIDLPSGLNADTGDPFDPVVSADLTVSLAAPKTGFANELAWDHLGHLEVADIGLPADVAPELAPTDARLQLIAVPELGCLHARRLRAAHKGDFGHVLVIGGSHGLGGAPALAAMGALRGGAGLVSAAVPENGLAPLAALAPSAMSHRIGAEQGAMTPATLADGCRPPAQFDVVLAGPGMSASPGTAQIVDALLRGDARRLVLDADALNVLAGRIETLPRGAAAPPLILTPHPGEAARLLGSTVAAVQSDRAAAARLLAARTHAIVVLKGAGTLVCTAEGEAHVNLTGNPGMATGGSGDVLSGLIAGLWAQGLAPFDAARLAVYLHGTAGDLAAWQAGETSLTAEDVGRFLGPAFRWLEATA